MAFYDSQPVYTLRKWNVHELDNGNFAVVNTDTGHAEYPVLYDCGTVGWDSHGVVPKRVREAVCRLYNPPGWFMFFHGGHSYAPFDVHNGTPERFDTLEDARWAFESRTVGFDRYYPCTDETATAWLFAEDPRRTGADYPDRVITLGPRNGVRITLS